MTTIKTNDETEFTASSATRLVEKLRADSFERGASLEEWMRGAAARAETQVGAKVRSDTPANFLTDLRAAGLIQNT